MINCNNCKWASCQHYGKDRTVCTKFIQDKTSKEIKK